MAEPNAWNHRVEVIDDWERRRYSLATSACQCGSQCEGWPTHWVSYECPTGPGRGARLRKRAACIRHARQFAEHSGIEFMEL